MSRAIVHRVILFFSGMLLLTSCAAWSGPPPIAPAQINPPSAHRPRLWPTTTTPVPTSAELVSLDDLSAHPDAYENALVEIHGRVDSRGGMIRNCPAGQQWMEAPITWFLVDPTKGKVIFGLTGYQKDLLVDRDHDHVAVWGWVRKYQGLLGCVDPTQSEQPQGVQWYLDPVQIQSLERE